MATIKRNASAKWSGSGKEGKGAITTQSGVLSDTPYSFSRRFGDEKGTNPGRADRRGACGLLHHGAGVPAHRRRTCAGEARHQGRCFARAGRGRLEDRRGQADHAQGKVPGMSKEDFLKLAETAKANCPVSKVLNATITLDATLE